MYVCMYVCMHIYINMCLCVCVYISIYIWKAVCLSPLLHLVFVFYGIKKSF